MGWERKQLGYLFNNRRESGSFDLPLLSLMDKKGIVPQDKSSRKDNSKEDKSAYLKVLPGDIVYNTMRMWEGRCAYSALEGLVSPAYTVCEPKPGVNSLLFSYYFKTPQLIEQFQRYSQGLVSDTLNLKFAAFSQISVLVPTYSEQRKIADCLSSLDDLIKEHERKLTALRNHKKGLMQQLFPQEGETIPRLRFPEFRYDKGWGLKRLEDIAPLQRGFDLPADLIRPGKIPIVYSNGIQKYHDVGMASAPGLVTGRSGTIGKLHFINEGEYWPHNTSLWVTDFKGNFPKFIYYLYDAIDMSRFASGSGVPTLNRNDVHAFYSSIPKLLSEQQKIASCLSALDDHITAQEDKIEILRRHKKGLLQQFFVSSGPTMGEGI